MVKGTKTFTCELTVASVDGDEVRLSHESSVSTAVLRQKGASKALSKGDVVDVVMTVRPEATEEVGSEPAK